MSVFLPNGEPANVPEPARQKIGLTQYEIADALGISRTAIYFVEQRALRKLRAAIIREAAAVGMSPLEWLRGDE